MYGIIIASLALCFSVWLCCSPLRRQVHRLIDGGRYRLYGGVTKPPASSSTSPLTVKDRAISMACRLGGLRQVDEDGLVMLVAQNSATEPGSSGSATDGRPGPQPAAAASPKPTAAWHVIYNRDGTFRGYEWALDDDGNYQPSIVLAQEGRSDEGRPWPSWSA